ncbi:MAG: VCBS repeat-containing protein [Gemmobacter sp.]
MPRPEASRTDPRPWPVAARLEGPTDRYPHNVLGGIPAFTDLAVMALSCTVCRHGSEGAHIRLAPPLVFEDVAPRLWDVTGDGRPEIVVVESHETRGARLAVWAYPDGTAGGRGPTRIAASAHIGARFRWLAPAGIGDFAGDGRRVIAWVDRPHLAQEVVFATRAGGRIIEIARAKGFSNHRIGETTIASTTRTCGTLTELILPRAGQPRLAALHLHNGRIEARDAGPYRGPQDLERAMRCP